MAHAIARTSENTSRNAELEKLGDEIAQLAAHLHAATYELLVRLREFDAREGWSGGFRSCAHWLSWRTGIATGAAREKVRVARALEALPQMSDGMRRGQLSFAKVRALTRIATCENETALLEVARHATAAQIEKIVRAWRRVDRLEEAREERARHESRYLTLFVQEDGSYEVRGRLDPEAGALLERALDAGSETLFGRRARGATPLAQDALESRESASQRRADALGWVAERALGIVDSPHRARAARFEVVLHVDGDALTTESATGQSVMTSGVRVSAETSRRLACDAGRVVMRHDAAGNVLDVGRRMRTVPLAIRRALDQRDAGCRFPGCGLRFCDAHHIVHWADGGATRLSNLVLLCRQHHRAVHEGGFRIGVSADGELHFYRPEGRLLQQVPAPPVLPGDPVAVLAGAHHALGIDATTPRPRWHGERLDLDFAIRTLRRAAGSTRAPG